MRYTAVRPGAFDPAPRLPDMDVEGIAQSVLYPTMLLGLPGLADAEFAEAQANAYNEWLAEYCAHAPTRLFGVAVVPTQDVERAVRTIRRAKKLGLVGVFMRPNPAIDERKLNDPIYDPIWRTCAELELPIGFHPFLAPDMPGACRALGYAAFRAEGVDYGRDKTNAANPINGLANVFFSQALSNPFDMMECAALMLRGRHLRALPDAHRALPRGERRLDRPLARAPRPSLRGLPLGRAVAQAEAVRVLPPPVLHLLRPRRVDARLHGDAPARRRRPHHLGERLPAPRREVPGRGEGARGSRRRRSMRGRRRRSSAGTRAALYHLPAHGDSRRT